MREVEGEGRKNKFLRASVQPVTACTANSSLYCLRLVLVPPVPGPACNPPRQTTLTSSSMRSPSESSSSSRPDATSAAAAGDVGGRGEGGGGSWSLPLLPSAAPTPEILWLHQWREGPKNSRCTLPPLKRCLSAPACLPPPPLTLQLQIARLFLPQTLSQCRNHSLQKQHLALRFLKGTLGTIRLTAGCE